MFSKVFLGGGGTFICIYKLNTATDTLYRHCKGLYLLEMRTERKTLETISIYRVLHQLSEE